MYLEIVTPEAVLFSSDITSVSVPGMDGEFQLLDHHAPIVSTLKDGEIRIESKNASLDDAHKDKFSRISISMKDQYKRYIDNVFYFLSKIYKSVSHTT